MQYRRLAFLSTVTLMASAGGALAQGQTLTIATVNNADMIIMQRLSPRWEQATGNKLNWVVLEENVLRQRATTDIATKGGQFDIMTIGSYEAPIWGKQNWLVSLDDLGNDYDYGDIIPSVKNGYLTTASSTPCRSMPRARSRSTERICSSRPASPCRKSQPMIKLPNMRPSLPTSRRSSMD